MRMVSEWNVVDEEKMSVYTEKLPNIAGLVYLFGYSTIGIAVKTIPLNSSRQS